ncbi:ATP-binding protein [Uliginosibacterium sp. H3]|uniref:histidine kinase n=1 Tax=Uliginosibacterium silvisoli TaxID=3114758 RepID=A0ABU6K8E2_9RHOO|nr:ATP-binding protein [Uliginosibacterium sp. H3]
MLPMKLRGFPSTPREGYLVAVIAAAVAIALRVQFEFVVAGRATYLFYVGAVVLASRMAGMRAGLLCLALTLLAHIIMIAPLVSQGHLLPLETASTLLFVVVGLAICIGLGHMHHTYALLAQKIREYDHARGLLSEEAAYRAESERRIRAHRDWLETTLTTIGDATILFDANGDVISMNPVAEHLCGWTRDTAKGLAAETIFPLFDDKSESPLESPVRKAILSGRVENPSKQQLLVNRDDVEYPVELSAAPMLDADRRVTGVVLVFRDMSARNRTQREMQRLLDELREADRLKDEFLALLAHELRNPLAPIRAAIDIVRMGDEGAVHKACDILQRQVENMARLVEDLLQVSRITHNQLEMRKVHTDLAPILRQALEISRPLIDAKSHRLVEEISSEPMPVHADPTRIAQLFANLLNNAAKFTDPGGEVALTVARTPDSVLVAVSDTGMGIPRGMEEKVFQLFAQLDVGISRSQGGLGIGLTLVQRIAHMHGGHVRVVRTEEPGTTFMVELPLALRQPVAIPVAAPEVSAAVPTTNKTTTRVERDVTTTTNKPGSPGSLSLRILVVDDNHDAADSMAVLLGILGSEVRIGHDGVEAVEAFKDFRPHAVLLDIGLPRLDGYGAAEQIRALPGGDAVTLIALSGYGRDDDRRRSREVGFDHHLVKPVAPDTLINLLAPLIAGGEVSPTTVN